MLDAEIMCNDQRRGGGILEERSPPQNWAMHGLAGALLG